MTDEPSNLSKMVDDLSKYAETVCYELEPVQFQTLFLLIATSNEVGQYLRPQPTDADIERVAAAIWDSAVSYNYGWSKKSTGAMARAALAAMGER